MRITIQPIMGIQLGFELYDSERNGQEIGYLLIDIFIVRIQLDSLLKYMNLLLKKHKQAFVTLKCLQ